MRHVTETPTTTPMRLLLFILSLTAFVYAPVVDLGFVSDDNGLIVNPVTGIDNHTVVSVFQNDLWHFQDSQSGYYRPLMMVSLLLDRALFGDWAGGYHLHSLVWHLLATFLLGRLLGRLFDPTRGAVAAAVYAVHPVVTETVCFISARNDTMALALGLAAVHLVVGRNPSRLRLLGATALAAGAVLSKENGLIVLGLLPLIDWARLRTVGGWHRHAALATGAMAALCLRELVGPGLHHSPPMNATVLMAENKLSVLGTMLSKLTWPTPLTDSLHIGYLGPVNLPAVTAAAFFILFVGIAGGRWARSGLTFFVLAFIPGLIAVASRYLIGERYLVMPLVGLLIAFAAICPRSPRLAWGLLGLVPWGLIAHDRVRDWSSDLTLAESAYSAQRTPYTAAWYGRELLGAGRHAEALPYLDEATAGQRPTCNFSAEWIRATGVAQGVDAALDTAQTVWDRGCAAAPGVRGAWALALLQAGEVSRADAILTPRPAACDRTLAVPMIVVHTVLGEQAAAQACAATSGMDETELERQVTSTLQRLPTATDRSNSGG